MVTDDSHHVDEYTRRHERAQLEVLRKEVRLIRTARLISLQGLIPFSSIDPSQAAGTRMPHTLIETSLGLTRFSLFLG